MREYWIALWESDWQPISKPAFMISILFYLSFSVYALRAHGGFLLIDNANLIVHEGGHLLFSYLGPTLMLWGGTLLQWLVPLLLAAYFFTQRSATGTTFCAFLFFENWLYTSTYMADARVQLLQLVTVGDPDQAGHDWYLIFSSLGLLQQDTRIATIIRIGGWIGMLGCIGWLSYRYSRDRQREDLVA